MTPRFDRTAASAFLVIARLDLRPLVSRPMFSVS
jgi:hypothetical protein